MSLLSGHLRFAALALLFVALAGAHLATGSLVWTGDEPQYTSQALGLYTRGALLPTPERWRGFVVANGRDPKAFPYSPLLQLPRNALVLSALYGPAVTLFGLEAGRWTSYILGCLGIVLLYAALRKGVGHGALTTILLVAATLPFVPYLQLIYPEMTLFCAVSAALWLLSIRNAAFATVLAAALPFIYARALPISAALIALILLSCDLETSPRRKVGFAVLYAAAIAAFCFSQVALYGSVSGGAFPIFRPSIAILPERIGMQLFDLRHGLLAYSPFYVFAFAGLIAGILRRNALCGYAAVLLLAYFATSAWSVAGESWSGRFWVAVLPCLAAGLCNWIAAVRRAWLPLFPAALLGIVNGCTFVAHPLWFLENRRGSPAYAGLFTSVPFHFALFLPVDADPRTLPPYTAPIPALLVFAGLAVGALTLCCTERNRLRALALTVSTAIMLVPFAVCAARAVPSSIYSVRAPAKGTIAIVFTRPEKLRALQFDALLSATWSADAFPSYFRIACRNADGKTRAQVEPARALVDVSGCSSAVALRVSAMPEDVTQQFSRAMRDVTPIAGFRL